MFPKWQKLQFFLVHLEMDTAPQKFFQVPRSTGSEDMKGKKSYFSVFSGYIYDIRRLASLHHDSYSYQLVLERVNTGQEHLGPSRNMLNNTTTQYKQHSRSRRNFRKSDLPAIVIYNMNKIAIFAILRPLGSHVPEIVETSIFFGTS